MTSFFISQQGVYGLIAVLPGILLMAGLVFTVANDAYLGKNQKRNLYIIAGMVVLLIAQNFVENRVAAVPGQHIVRTVLSTIGYCLRPAILVMFVHVVEPGSRNRIAWGLIALNAVLYVLSPFTHLCFWIDEENFFRRGPLTNTCLVVSTILLVYLLMKILYRFKPQRQIETWIPLFNVLMIVIALVLDGSVGSAEQPVSFLTLAVVVAVVFLYMWLHLQFVRSHEKSMENRQHLQIMAGQVHPLFLYNTLNTIRMICVQDPVKAMNALGEFNLYLRQNMDSMGKGEMIPFEKELEHTRIYTEIEVLRYPDIQVEYRIEDVGFMLPALTVQPLVENAVSRIGGLRENGKVAVISRREEHDHVVEIRDNGVCDGENSFGDEENLHVDVDLIRKRVEQMCGGTMQVESGEEDETVVTIRIPDEMSRLRAGSL